MSIARTSHRQRERLFLQLHKWHIMIVRAGEQKDVLTRPNMSRGWTLALCTDRKASRKIRHGGSDARHGEVDLVPRIRRAERKCLVKCHG